MKRLALGKDELRYGVVRELILFIELESYGVEKMLNDKF